MKHFRLSKVKSNDTKPEKLVRKFLWDNSIRYRKNYKKWPGKPDIAFPGKKKVIFIHGCYWHRHKNCKFSYTPKSNQEFWEKKFVKNLERDIKNQKSLYEMQISFIIIWECELKNKSKWEKKVLDFVIN